MVNSGYLLKRTAFMVVTIYVVITLNFFMFRILPGSAVTNLARVPQSTPALRHHLTEEFGLNESPWQQYVLYLRELAHGNLGISFANQQPVWANLKSALGNTLPVVTIATVLSLLLGVATGVLSAWRRGSKLDQISTNASIVLYSLPTQWIALVLLIALSKYLPTAGTSDPFALGHVAFWPHLVDQLRHMVLPALTLVLTLYGGNTLIVRSALLETLGEDYMLTARAKGVGKRRMMRSHALRNAMLPITTLVTLSFGTIVAGAILMEVVFSWPGLGSALYQAVQERDYPMLQGGFLLVTISVIVCNFIADLLYFALDPRIAA
ncbi:MAG TPA: ABC transporter permease [Nocardioides sp.]|jgi:ABC-type dipeptide/oligopeptide/nickel transport system permease component|nr:ABC transporter permease [Nocardioides sp.]